VAVEALHNENRYGFAAELLLEFVEKRPDEYLGYHWLVETYLEMDQPLLAEMWARNLLSRKLSYGDEAYRPAGYRELLRALRAAGKYDEARKKAIEAVERVPNDVMVAKLVVELRSEDPKKSGDPDRSAIQTAVEPLCGRPHKEWKLLRCWLGNAWIDEYEGRLRDAEYGYERVARRLDRPEPLGRFLARHGKCVELNKFVGDWKKRSEPAGGKVRQLEKMSRKCSEPK
jgi:tetratricopeptide (TPR) repeat protein